MRKKVLICLAAGAMAVVLVAEIPEMIRYYKMMRL